MARIVKSRTVTLCDAKTAETAAKLLFVYNKALTHKCGFTGKVKEFHHIQFANQFRLSYLIPYIKKERRRGRVAATAFYTKLTGTSTTITVPNLNITYERKNLRIPPDAKILCGIVSLFYKYNTPHVKITIAFQPKLTPRTSPSVCGVDFNIDNICVNGQLFYLSKNKKFRRRLNIAYKRLDKLRRHCKNTEKINKQIALILRLKKRYKSYLRNTYNYICKRICKQYNYIGLEKALLPQRRLLYKYKLFASILQRHARDVDAKVIRILPVFTSRICSKCGSKNEKEEQYVKTFVCSTCLFHEHRDVNAAKNIEKRTESIVREALRPLGRTPDARPETKGRYQRDKKTSAAHQVPGKTESQLSARFCSLIYKTSRFTRHIKKWNIPRYTKIVHIAWIIDRIVNLSGTHGELYSQEYNIAKQLWSFRKYILPKNRRRDFGKLFFATPFTRYKDMEPELQQLLLET